MTRYDSSQGTRAVRVARLALSIGSAAILALAASGCASRQDPAPAADRLAGVADRSDQAYLQGLEAYGQGQYQSTVTSFQQARALSPAADARFDQMIDRSLAAMVPTLTPVPPPPAMLPATPAPRAVAQPAAAPNPIAMSSRAPDSALGQSYFGDVTLGVVPSRNTDPVPATEFFLQDQIGLSIDKLKQPLLPLLFTLRVFDADSGRLIANVHSEDDVRVSPVVSDASANGANGPAPDATPHPNDYELAHFWNSYVWYHKGGEQPGHYRVELYASGELTNTFDYSVNKLPVQLEATLEASPTPSPEPETTTKPDSEPPTPQPTQVRSVPVRVASTPTAIPQPTAIPSPTPVPTPAKAYTTVVGGLPAGLDVDSVTGRFYLADASGVIWSADAPTGQERPTLGTPFNLEPKPSVPVDLAVDQSTGNLFIALRAGCPAQSSGIVPAGCLRVVDGRNGLVLPTVVNLPSAPGDVRIDSELGLLYVSLPSSQALGVVDVRSNQLIGTIPGFYQITSLAIDPLRHVLYAGHLAGQVTVVDVATSQVMARVSLTGAGLTSVATARGLAYAVNTATHELAVLEPFSQSVSRFMLSQEPAAVAAAEDTGAIYVLTSRHDVILRIDPSDGSELGRVLLADRSGNVGLRPNDMRGLRPRMVLNPADDTIFATFPEAGSLAAVANSSFPVLAHEIPFPEIPDQALASDIPAVLRPAAITGERQIASGR